MVFARKTAIRLANLFLSRSALDPERFVVIFALSHIKRRGDWGTGRQGDKETGEGKRHYLPVSSSPCRPVPQSPRLLLYYFTPWRSQSACQGVLAGQLSTGPAATRP